MEPDSDVDDSGGKSRGHAGGSGADSEDVALSGVGCVVFLGPGDSSSPGSAC